MWHSSRLTIRSSRFTIHGSERERERKRERERDKAQKREGGRGRARAEKDIRGREGHRHLGESVGIQAQGGRGSELLIVNREP